MKPAADNQSALTGRLRIRLLAYLAVAISVVCIPVITIYQQQSLDQLLQQEMIMLNQLAELSMLSSTNSKENQHLLVKTLRELPWVIAAEPLPASAKINSDENIVWLDTSDGQVIKLQLDATRHTQLAIVVWLYLVIASVIVLVLSWFLFSRYEEYFKRLAAYITDLRNGVNSGNVDIDCKINEFHRINHALNKLSERVNMQSMAVSRGFEELSHVSELFEHAPSLIVTISTELDVSYLNKAYKEMLPDKYLNQDVISLLPENIGELVSQSLLDNKVVQGIETKMQGRNFLWSIVPVPAQAKVNCYGVDITQIREAESQTESAVVDSMIARDENEAKSIFLANMSHEIRTPLTAIIGFSESLLESGQSMEERVVGINTIIRNARHLLSIVNDLLDITRIESGQVIVELETLSVQNIIEDVYQNFAAQAQTKGIAFNLDVQYPLPVSVISDDARIRQILFNLCSNAVKFTSHGDVNLQVAYDKHKTELIFTVKDTGQGIRPSQIDKIFNRFEQLEKGHARKFGGAGLGLYITRELVERLHGSIKVESEPGVGSRFTVAIKAELAGAELIENDQQLQSHLPEQENRTGCYQGKVLLVEDNIDNQNLVKLYLSKMGAQVSVASNGQEAVQLAGEEMFDLILMDMQMPVMDGVEATKLIHASGNEAPIVMLTANVMHDDMQLCRTVGCNGFLTKPIERNSFERYVVDFLAPVDNQSLEQQPVISELVNEGPEFYNIVKAYVKQLPGDLKAVIDAFKTNDDDVLKSKVHSMKGTSGNMGFIEYSQLCAQVEFAITKNDRDEIMQLIETLEAMKARIIAGVEN